MRLGRTTSLLPWVSRPIFKVLVFIAFAGVTSVACGCGTIRYLAQAGRGQLSMLQHARPIEAVIIDPKTPPRTKALLAEIPPIKKYGEALGLKPTRNYVEYVQLDRPAAVWVVSASAPLEFKSKQWHFPIVGDIPYLGWFDLSDAKHFAAELRAEGLDVDVRGASAYSTLGWFRDAILSSMIPERAPDAPGGGGDPALGALVNVVIHESVHATVYVEGQPFFNESLASFVADSVTPSYLESIRGAHSAEEKSYLDSEQSSRARGARLHRAYEELKSLYETPSHVKSDEKKRQEKEAILSALKKELSIQREINNATLIQFKTYHAGTAGFDRLFASCGRDWPRFMRSVSGLNAASFVGKSLDSVLIETKCR